MRKVLRVLFVALILSVFVLPQIAIERAYADDVTFSGVTAPISVNVRTGATLKAPVLYQIAGNTKVDFDGWVYGDSINDYWSSEPDNRWFFFSNEKKEKLYIASGVINGNPPSAPGEATVPNVQQAKSNWCWAAVSSSVLQHYNLTISQQQVAIYVKGGVVNEPASNYDIVRALRNFGLNATSFNGVPSYGQVQRQINNGNPMINLINWTNGGDHYDYAYDYYKNNSKFWWNLYIDSFSKK